jgi:hypothetical protein
LLWVKALTSFMLAEWQRRPRSSDVVFRVGGIVFLSYDLAALTACSFGWWLMAGAGLF